MNLRKIVKNERLCYCVKPPQPYWSHALERFPKDDGLLGAIAGYLEMRTKKKSGLSVAEWDSCLDELLEVFDIATDVRNSKVRKISKKKSITIPELTYLFLTATARKWNHVFFTSDQDRMYANISYYQDPYWNDIKNNPETLVVLREELGDIGSAN